MFLIKKFVAIFFVTLTLVLLSATEVDAQTTTPAQIPAIIQYDLAFPGMLPDRPLYKIKVFRDKLRLVITSDPKKRIDLLLHFADKGVLASAILVDKNQWTLAKETALKAEHNITLITEELNKLYERDGSIDQAILVKLQTASLKHQEVLAKLRERVPAEDQLVFSQVIEFSQRNQAEIEKYTE